MPVNSGFLRCEVLVPQRRWHGSEKIMIRKTQPVMAGLDPAIPTMSEPINRDHEVMNAAVLIGAFTAVLGSILVSLDTGALTAWLGLPGAVARFLGYRLAGG